MYLVTTKPTIWRGLQKWKLALGVDIILTVRGW